MTDTIIEHRGLRLEIIRDDDASNPEDMTDSPVYLVHFHRQFERCPKEVPFSNINGFREFIREGASEEWAVFLVTAEIHGGVSLSVYSDVRSFDPDERRSLGWDTSLVGAVLIQKDPKYWGDDITDDGFGEHTWEAVAEAHVAEWNQYLSGDVWGYRVIDPDTGDELDSCWGFYGQKHCIEEATYAADSYAAARDEKAAALAGLVQAIKDIGDDDILDEAVHGIFSEQASSVNNEGVEAQVKFLLQAGYSLDAIAKMVTP